MTQHLCECVCRAFAQNYMLSAYGCMYVNVYVCVVYMLSSLRWRFCFFCVVCFFFTQMTLLRLTFDAELYVCVSKCAARACICNSLMYKNNNNNSWLSF